MTRKYTKVEELSEIIRARKAAGETNRAIGESYGLSLKQVKGLISRQNRKERMLAAGYVLDAPMTTRRWKISSAP